MEAVGGGADGGGHWGGVAGFAAGGEEGELVREEGGGGRWGEEGVGEFGYQHWVGLVEGIESIIRLLREGSFFLLFRALF